MVDEMLKTNEFSITAITRAGGNHAFAPAVHIKEVDYSNTDSLKAAFIGQDALIITLPFTVMPADQIQMIEAAGEAGVPWIIPNEYGADNSLESITKADLGRAPGSAL